MMSDLNNFVQTVGVTEQLPSVLDDSSWKQLSVAETLSIPCQKPDIEQLTKVIVEAEIINLRLIDTPILAGGGRATNLESDASTGKKIVVEGILKQKVVYVANCSEQPVHAAHFETPFSSYIVVSNDADNIGDFRVMAFIEDIFIEQLSKRTIFKNITLFLLAMERGN